MFCNPCHNCLSDSTGEDIVSKIEVLDTSLFGDDLRKKVDIAGYFPLEPLRIICEIKDSDG